MKLWSTYHVPRSVEEAIALLAQYDGHAQVIAGGTDLLIDIQAGNHPPAEVLIDITKIDALNKIKIVDDEKQPYALIGASVTHSAIVAAPVIGSRATCLAESCSVVGGPQVRNVATIGGNVVHALPAADGTLSLVALNAQAEVATENGHQMYPIEALFTGPGKSIVDPTRSLLTQFRVPLTSFGEGSAFQRIMRPQGVALPILGCAVWLRLDPALERFADVSICLGPVGPVPQRAHAIESSLIGQPADESAINAAAQLAKGTLAPRTSKYRATAEYRTEMIEVLLRVSLETALVRARTGEAVLERIA
ncbi:MAG: FAD binding domain-containing protein [Aggregatilineales bacterium]